MDLRYKARVSVPDFWPVDEAAIRDRLATVPAERLVKYGSSAGGRDLYLVRCPNPGKPRLWVIGGTHGHEPGTVASCFNFLHILEHGEDLKGKPWPDMAELSDALDITVVPVFNPDGRARCPDSFVGWPTGGLDGMAQSWDKSRRVIQIDEAVANGINPDDVIFLGGRFNDSGFLANRPVDVNTTLFVEFQQLLQYMESEPPECYIDLHACGSNFFCMNRGFTEPYRRKLRKINEATAEAIRAFGHQYSGDIYGDTGTADEEGAILGNVRILYVRFGTLAFPYEGRQGFLDILPWCEEADIVDDYLIAVRETMRLGVEEGYIP